MKIGLRDWLELEGFGRESKGSHARDLIALLRFARGEGGKKKKEEEKKKGNFNVDELTWMYFFAIPLVPVYLLLIWYIWGAALSVMAPHVAPHG